MLLALAQFQWFLLAASTLIRIPLVFAAFAESLEPSAFVRRRYHASAKVGDWIYIDGGEFGYVDSNGTVQSGPTSKTHALDLTESWTNSTVQLREIDRGAAPLRNLRTFWVDESKSTIYTYGGEISWSSFETPSFQQPWKFIADGRGGGNWTQIDIVSGSEFSSLSQPASGSHTFSNRIGYYFGGHLVEKTYPSRSWYPVSGLITYNMSSNMWTNTTSIGYGNLVPHHGIAEYVPQFGSSGLVVWMGGRASSDTEITGNDPFVSFTNITVYDPSSGKWSYQRASGTIPADRDRACAVGVAGENNTYEIFIYAGTNTGEYGGPYPTEDQVAGNNALDQVFVLTLPAFVWFKANYTAVASRQAHTCQLVGNRQLLTIGGTDPAVQEHYAIAYENATDTFAQGLGIFDLTEMTWSDSYDAKAPAYKSPQVVTDYYRSKSRFPVKWDSAELQEIFGDRSSSTSATSITSSTPSPTGGSSSEPYSDPSGNNSNRQSPNDASASGGRSKGVVVGAAVGASLAALGLGCALLYLYIRKQRRRLGKKKPNIKIVELHSHHFGELPDQHRVELPQHIYWEMPADPMSPKVRISAVEGNVFQAPNNI